MTSASERFWRACGRNVVRRANAFWWLHSLLALVLGLTVVAAPALLIWRRQGWDTIRLALALGVLLLVLAVAGWFRARRRFFSQADGLVLLEVALGLDARLSAASAGVGAFPPIDRRARRALRIRRPPLLLPFILASAALLAAAMVPISRAVPRSNVGEPPPEWAELESWMTGLREADIVAPEALGSWEERLAALRQQPKDHWYDPSSLEAADALKDDLRRSLRSLADGLDSAEEELTTLSAPPRDDDSAGARREAGKRLEHALSTALRNSLPMKPELADKLKGLSQARRLSPEELSRLRQRLQQGSRSFRSALLECRNGHKLCTRQECLRGSGAIQRGPGPAPLILMAEKSAPGTTAAQALPETALKDAQIGDVVKVELLPHPIDRKAYRGSLASGAAGVGAGGEAVWRSSVTPEERALLERYFR